MARPPQPQPPDLELSAEVCAFLSDLRKEEVELLQVGIRAMRAFLIVGAWIKWMVVTLTAAFVGGIALWQAAQFLGQQLAR